MLTTAAAYLFVIISLIVYPTVVCAGSKGVACFSPDGAILASPQDDCTVVLWDVPSSTKITSLYEPDHHKGGPQVIACYGVLLSFSPDGRLLATQRSFEPIVLWSIPECHKLATLDAEGNETLEFSSDSKLIVSVAGTCESKSCRRNRVTVWDVATRKQLLHLSQSGDWEFRKASLSPDGKTLMAIVGLKAYVKHTIKLWDIERAKELVTLKGDAGSFSPDGRFLLITDRDSEDTIWDIREGKMLLLDKHGDALKPQSK